MKEPSENELSIGLCTRFKIYQAYNIISRDILLIHIPNESIGGKGWNIQQKRKGVVAGAPDFLYMGNKGMGGFIELKRNSKCPLSPAQKTFRAMCVAIGIPHDVVWDIDVAMNILRDFSITNS